jgi:hypothetical protein
MKITVITDRKGKVLGSVRHAAGTKGAPAIGLVAGAGQTAHELELPRNLESVQSGDELHKALAELVKKRA